LKILETTSEVFKIIENVINFDNDVSYERAKSQLKNENTFSAETIEHLNTS
jgi:hypothetical protein